MNALILVDLQKDFVCEGALAVDDGDQIVPVANLLMPYFDLVVATQDWHPNDHLSFAAQHSSRQIGDEIELEGLPQVLWPDHCVEQSKGAELLSMLDMEGIHQVFQKGTHRTIDSYSGFFDNGHRHATGLENFLRDQQVTDVYIMGLATDYCVKYTALDAVKLGFRTHLVLDGCRGVELTAGDVERAVEQMQLAGIYITSAAQTIEQLSKHKNIDEKDSEDCNE